MTDWSAFTVNDAVFWLYLVLDLHTVKFHEINDSSTSFFI
jgi:hypothetical protein